MGSVGELSKVCSQIVLKCLYFGTNRKTRHSVVAVNKLARAVTKWTQACDRRLARLHTSDYWQYCHVGSTAQHCGPGLFQDSDFPGDLEHSKSTSLGGLCMFGSRTFVPTSWMCKKQTSVSHSSTDAEIVPLDAGLRMDGVPAPDLWDFVIEVFHSSPNQSKKTKDQVRGDSSRSTTSNKHTKHQTKTPIRHDSLELSNVEYVSSNATSSQSGATPYIFEDNEAVIKLITKGRSPTMRHVSRTHRVARVWLFDRINLDPQNPSQICRHQTPTRRHIDEG